jgi:hypothetical protein
MASTPQNEQPRVLPAIDAAAEQRRAAIDGEIAVLQRCLKSYPYPQQAAWMRRRLDRLVAMRDAPADPRSPAPAESPDLSKVPPWAREIVAEHIARQEAGRAAARRQAAEAEQRAHEEAVTADRRASLNAPMMGHMGNRAGENFRLREPQRLTRIFSTLEQRHIAAVRQRQAEDTRNPVANIHSLPTSSDNNAPVPRCNLRPPAFWDLKAPDSTRSTDLSAAMP